MSGCIEFVERLWTVGYMWGSGLRPTRRAQSSHRGRQGLGGSAGRLRSGYHVRPQMQMRSRQQAHVDDFLEVLRWSKEFGVDTPDGRDTKQGVVGVFAAGALKSSETPSVSAIGTMSGCFTV